MIEDLRRRGRLPLGFSATCELRECSSSVDNVATNLEAYLWERRKEQFDQYPEDLKKMIDALKKTYPESESIISKRLGVEIDDITQTTLDNLRLQGGAATVRRTPPLIPLCLPQLYVRAGKACEASDFPGWQTAVEGEAAAAAAAPELRCVNSCTKSRFEPTLRAQLLISQ
jgi:hypothetical protein